MKVPAKEVRHEYRCVAFATANVAAEPSLWFPAGRIA
jgi:hypothetical protein